jgi:hypothetical protein
MLAFCRSAVFLENASAIMDAYTNPEDAKYENKCTDPPGRDETQKPTNNIPISSSTAGSAIADTGGRIPQQQSRKATYLMRNSRIDR